MNTAERPDVEQILSRLKDFQRRTVDYVVRRFYHDTDRVNRFLVADEVGLGKTMVARGVIARAIDELWDKVRRIDIVYICANAEIAHQNLNRLNIYSDRKMAFSTRLTLLPMQIRDLRGNKLNFVSFTPGTSFDLRSREGMAEERALIYHMLRRGWQFGDYAGPKNLLQCYVQRRDAWRERLDRFPSDKIDEGLQNAFMERLARKPDIRSRFDELADRFGYSRKHVPYRDRREQLELVGDLRRVLAEACVDELEPDLVIMDEFQRFKDLLDGEDEVAVLAKTLFNYPDAKVLLLSATPYKMYTIYHETEDGDHYRDFLRTVSFLQDSPEATRAFEEKLARYRRELLSFEPGRTESLDQAKHDVEQALRRVMCRTERFAATEDRDGMVCHSLSMCMPTAQELRAYAALDAVARALGVMEPMEYWKSAPYVLSIMDRQGYKLKEEFVKALAELEAAVGGGVSIPRENSRAGSEVGVGVDARPSSEAEARVTSELEAALGKCRSYMLSWETVKHFGRIDPCNARLRALM
ncbi:MAG: DEAD/DEAH box helicase family protein, partial [Firmicutes bacterium]|nr:DEAD/DEAH box helicase family protein [Bacillota bacterium]